MFSLNVDYMNLVDRTVLAHLKKAHPDGEVHVIYRLLADELNIARNTAYRSVKRLRDAGHLETVNGNRRVGYTYRIN